jgi:hypothetical protein
MAPIRSLARLLAVATGALVLMSAVATLASCSGVDTNAVTEVTGPDFSQFAMVSTSASGNPVYGVSVLLERRCGTLDCHGQIGRPLRIYGQYGLRFVDDGGAQPGVQPTTATEHEANYQSVIGLQPELMTEVVQDNAPPTALMLLRKPLQLERHKGGAVITAGDDGENCLESWLGGDASFASCTAAVAQ